MLRSIDEKIGDNKTNNEVAGELGNNPRPTTDIFGELDDAEIEEAEESTLTRSDAD